MRLYFLIAVTALMLTGCAEYQARRQAQAQAQAAQIEYSKQQYCTDMGAPPGSKDYIECRKMIAQSEQAMMMQRAAMNQAYMQAQPTANDIGNAAMAGIAGNTYINPQDAMIARQQGLPLSAFSPPSMGMQQGCGFKPFPPMGCRMENARCTCDPTGNCYWSFVGCN